MFVLDADEEGAEERLRAVRPDLADELWECGAVVQSGRGKHYYFKAPDKHPPVAQSAGKAIKHLPDTHIRKMFDVKGGGAGYTVLPPTNGREWDRGSLDTIHEASAALLKALEDEPAAAPGGRVRQSLSTFGPGREPLTGTLPKGTPRHPVLRDEMYALRMRGYGQDEIEALMLALNRRLFEEPKPDDVVIEQVRYLCANVEAGEIAPAGLLEGEDTAGGEDLAAPVDREPRAEVVPDGVVLHDPRTSEVLYTPSAGGVEAWLKVQDIEMALDPAQGRRPVWRRGGGEWKPFTRTDQLALREELRRTARMPVSRDDGGEPHPEPFVIRSYRDEDSIYAWIASQRELDTRQDVGVMGEVREWAMAAPRKRDGWKTHEILKAACGIKRADVPKNPQAAILMKSALLAEGWDQVRIPTAVDRKRRYRWVPPGHTAHRGSGAHSRVR